MSQVLPPKKDVALALLERASVFVHLDPRGAGVVVPVHFKRQPRLVLQIGLNMAVPIPDLRLDDQGLSCTLSFNRSLFHCVVPWSGIFALVGEDGRGMVWPEDVPQEIAREMAPQQAAKEERPDKPEGASPQKPGGLTGVAGGRKRPHVALVASGGVRADSKRASKPSKGAVRRKRDDADKPTLFKVEAVEATDDAPSKASKPSKPGAPSAAAGPAGGKKRAEESRPSEGTARREAGQSAKPSAKPSTSEGAAASPAAPQSPSGASTPSAPAAPVAPNTPSSSPPGKRSPKRELPPYLRVVK
jgi:stringent starvation protein B